MAAIVSIAQSLDLELVAEGITRHDQVERLLELGCQRGQGFLYSRPVEAVEIEALLEASTISEEREPRILSR